MSFGLAACVKRFGGLHIAFKSAGDAKGATRIVDQSVYDWDFTVELCLKA